MLKKRAKPGNSGDTRYREVFNTVIGDTIGHAIRIIGDDPSLLIPGTLILRHQRKAATVRRKHEQNGLFVPPVMIVSITSRCNLTCAGCYMHGRRENAQQEMGPEILSSVVSQADELGVSIVVIAGGEPFVRYGEILGIAKTHPRILFPVFTNGLLIDREMATEIASSRNIVPIISFEGFRTETDARRGSGVYDRLLAACAELKSQTVFFGCSVTITKGNFDDVTGDPFIIQMLGAGIRIFTYVEYVPMTSGTEELVLTSDQKKKLQTLLSEKNQRFPALFIGFPGDEEYYGGCLAAGRGFVHVSPSGNLEPCPAAPYSDANLVEMPLEQALHSRLLGLLREEPEILNESAGGCALRANRAWVEGMMVQERK